MSTDAATGKTSHPYNGVLGRIQNDERELAELEGQAQSQAQEQEALEPTLADNALGAEEATFKKRYGDLRRWTQKQLQESKQREQELANRLREASATKLVLPKTEEELQEFANDYPDLFGLIETAVLTRVNQTREDIEARFAEIAQEKHQTAREKAENNLRKEHPDLTEITSDPKFHEWASNQSKMTRSALYENETDWQSASDAIYLYKSYLQRSGTKPKKTDQGAAEAVPTRGGTTRAATPNPSAGKYKWSESKLKALSTREADRLWPEIQAAIDAGEMDYDITGAAR